MKNKTQTKNQFIQVILKSLQMEQRDFMENLSNGEHYEVLMYDWIIELFNLNKTLEESIHIIHKRRIQSLQAIGAIPTSNEEYSSMSKSFEKVMSDLNKNPTYLNLKNVEKKKVNKRVIALLETRLYNHPEITQFAINIINTLIENGKKTNGKEEGFSLEFNPYFNSNTTIMNTLTS